MAYNFLHIFFVFSGLMVAMSLDRRQSLANYAAARSCASCPRFCSCLPRSPSRSARS